MRERSVKLTGGMYQLVSPRDRYRIPGRPVEMVNYVPDPEGYALTDGYAAFPPPPGSTAMAGAKGPVLGLAQVGEFGEAFVYRELSATAGALGVWRLNSAGTGYERVANDAGLVVAAPTDGTVRSAVFGRATVQRHLTEVYFVTGRGNEVTDGTVADTARRGLFRIYYDSGADAWKVGAVRIGTEVNADPVLRYPEYVTEHKHHIVVGFPAGSLQFSPLGEPAGEWTVLTGAGEIGVGQRITDFVSGYQGVLFVLTEGSVFVLRGETQGSFALDEVAGDYGALSGTAQLLEKPLIFSSDGIRSVSAQDAGTGIEASTLSQAMQPLVERIAQDHLAPLSSFVIRGKSQYRVNFSGGLCIVAAYVGRANERGEEVTWELSTLRLPAGIAHASTDLVRVGAAGAQGERVLYALEGDTDGVVYQEGTTERGAYPPKAFGDVPIKGLIRLGSNDFGTPRRQKRFRTVHVSGRSAADLRLGVVLNDQSRGVAMKVVPGDVDGRLYESPGRWDTDDWDSFLWGGDDETDHLSSEARLQTRASAFRLTLYTPHESQPGGHNEPHVLASAHIGFLPGRDER